MWLASMEGENHVDHCLAAAKFMRSFKEMGAIVLPAIMREQTVAVCGITGSSSHSNASSLATIKIVNDEDGYVLDPHTGDADSELMKLLMRVRERTVR